MNNLHMNGGLIDNGSNGGKTINLSGKSLILDSGTIRSGNAAAKTCLFQNGNMTGSGTINITGQGTSDVGAEIEFASSMITTNFTGIFNIYNYGQLNLVAIATNKASFGLTISGSGQLNNDANIALTSLTLGADVIGNGAYTAADLVGINAGYAAYFTNAADDTLTITVIPEPATLGMIVASASLLLAVRRMVV